MLEILIVSFFFLQLQAQEKQSTFTRPMLLNNEFSATRLQHRHLINMTENFCKDAGVKLRMAELVQETYMDTHGYELGIIAASLMEKFRFMIRVYRYYTDHKGFKDRKYNLPNMLTGYSVMQGTYNELMAETILYYKILAYHKEKDQREHDDAKVLAKKYKMSVGAIKDLKKAGRLEDLELLMKGRRSLQTQTKLPEHGGKPLDEKVHIPRQFLLGDSKYINVWTPKKDSNTQEEAYKKKLRFNKWAETWNGFDGETEGINIADTIARLGLSNDSNFLLKELKGAV